MTILSDWNNRKHNARLFLLGIFRELREVLESDLLPTEKRHLFVKAHCGEIRDRAWLVRPDLYEIEGKTFEHPAHHKGDNCLRTYLDDLGNMLEYGKHKAELLAAVHDVAGVMDMNLPIKGDGPPNYCPERKEEFKKHLPRLEAAFKALRLEPHDLRAPVGGYFWDTASHRQWIEHLQKCAARA